MASTIDNAAQSGSLPPGPMSAAASQAVVPMILEKCARIGDSLSARPEAIVLTGSFARNEGSIMVLDGRAHVLGDMEFMIIFPEGSDLNRLQPELTERARTVRAELAGSVDCELEFTGVTTNYLRDLQPQIFGYEFLSHGRAIWGDEQILAKAPRFPASQIPRFDAWRMLNNRLIEQLEWADTMQTGDRWQLLKIVYQMAKGYMDIGTTVLLFMGKYEDTYADRAKALSELAETSTSEDLAFARTLAERVAECTAFKVAPDLNLRPLGVNLDTTDTTRLREDICRALAEMVNTAREVWRWEAARISGRSIGAAAEDDEVRDAALGTQQMREILRGWVKIALMSNVRREPDFARRMAKRILQGSPRYLTYCVASELFFQMPTVLAGGTPEISSEDFLPVKFAEHADEPRAWWRLRADVLRGWRLFLRNQWA
jgi:hypothetical protein